MWPKALTIAGMALTFPLIFAPAARAELASGSVLNIASQGASVMPDRKVMIELEADNRLVFRSGQTGRLLPTANQGSQLTLGLGTDRQINILPSSAAFANAYADTRTTIQDLPLNSLGIFQGEIPGFIQNIWLKTAGGAREMVSFTLFSVNYNAQTGQGEMSGAFITTDGQEQFANGGFNLDPTDDCACNYTLQLEVQTIAGGGGPPGGGSPAAGGSSGGAPAASIGGPPGGGSGIGGAFPLLALAALPFLSNDDNPVTPTQVASNPAASPPAPEPPPNPPTSVPTPALLPGLMGLVWKARQRPIQAENGLTN